jgi:aldose 1-epimerase
MLKAPHFHDLRVRIGAGAAALALVGGGSLAMALAPAASASPASHGSLSVSSQYFGSTTEPYTGKTEPVYRYTLSNAEGMQVKVLTFGGIVQQIIVPGRNGQKADVVLGFNTLADYVKQDSPPVTTNGGPYFGETIGRYGNRIANGKFTLDQPGVGPVTYTLPINNNGNTLHGGLVGFGNHIWKTEQVIHNSSEVGVDLQLTSPNGDQSGGAGSPGCPNGCTGFPAQITLNVTFTLNNSDQLGINYKTHDDSSNLNTVINLTNHSYFNLAGESSPAGSAYSQKVQINANDYTPTNTTQIPLGYNAGVKGTPFDFTQPKAIGAQIGDITAPDNSPGYNQLLLAQGYDHNWVLNKQTGATTGPDSLNLAAHAWDPSSGRELSVWTDQPGVQFYSGNFLTGTLTGGIDGQTFRQGGGYTFETQHFPDSPNQPSFPSTELNAGQTISSTTVFAFNS